MTAKNLYTCRPVKDLNFLRIFFFNICRSCKYKFNISYSKELNFWSLLYFPQGDKVQCVRPPCDTPCTYPTQGACCPLCDNCEFEGKIRPNGATFKPDACRTCTCTVSLQHQNNNKNNHSCEIDQNIYLYFVIFETDWKADTS